jgi:ABC-type nitrate/sulfonate/bicarbonate transport system substrate-binding protein
LTPHLRPFIALALLAVMAVPLPVAAVADGGIGSDTATPVFDTPAPKATPKPAPRATPKPTPKPTKKPTPKPTKKPVLKIYALAPHKAALRPASGAVSVALPSDDADLRAPLQFAIDEGFMKDAGFDEVELVAADSTIEALRAGEQDFAVADTLEAFAAFVEDPSLQAVAGYQNYAGEDGAYGGSVLLAAPGLVAEEPSTVSAFTKAYARALRKLGKADAPDGGAFAPYDGGFGSRKVEAGWGELTSYVSDALGEELDLEAFVSEHTLNVGQASLGMGSNPLSAVAGKPASSEIVIGLPVDDLAGSPIQTAKKKRYFKSAGLTDVTITDVEEPLLGLLQGELDFAVIDALDAADGYSQGLPLAAISAHRNYGDDGAYGGDVIAVSQDFLEQEGSTVTAFLTAYLRAMRDGQDADEASDFAPFDGGFGTFDPELGWSEFAAYVSEAIGTDTELDGFVASDALERARTWWGIPAVSEPDEPSTTEENE